MFVDQVKVYARAGHGGRGCVAFHREAYAPKGGPSGGNGGRGGDVILQADHDLNNLINQYFVPRLIAQNGDHGMGKGMDGHAGKDVLIKVPCGTLVWRLDPEVDPVPAQEAEVEEMESQPIDPTTFADLSGGRLAKSRSGVQAVEIDLEADEPLEPADEPKQGQAKLVKGELVADLTEDGQTVVLCKGGRGGLGNRNFATSRRQAPRFAQPGEPGMEGNFLFELRLIAEVGIVGYPNAGKSTLLAAISRARPKIAPYPFTTLHPQIGIVEFPDFKRITVCDVPGLIEGAHQNVGLGHSFLRHIQRCKTLILLVDMAGTDGRDPWDDYKQLLREIELYDPAMLQKPRHVVANKMDEAAAVANLPKFKRRITKTPVLPISAAYDDGIDKFLKLIRDAVENG